jgi:amino acid transporter
LITLARKLRVVDYFALGWGTMVGVGWLVVMDDWLLRGGTLGGVLGFAIGGTLLLPIGYVYGQLVTAMPDAAGEVAYTAKVFPRSVSFATGWMMILAYFIVCPWEAVAVGRIAGYIFPALDSMELYRIAGRPVYLPHVIIGLGLTSLLTWMNYRGIRLSATFQNPGFVRGVCRGRSEQGFAAKFSAAVHPWRICFHPACNSDRALLHDGL